ASDDRWLNARGRSGCFRSGGSIPGGGSSWWPRSCSSTSARTEPDHAAEAAAALLALQTDQERGERMGDARNVLGVTVGGGVLSRILPEMCGREVPRRHLIVR